MTSDDACHKIWRVGLEAEEDNKEVTIRGQAEAVERGYFLEKMKTETTPSSRHSIIYQETTPSSDEHMAFVLTPGKNKTCCEIYANK